MVNLTALLDHPEHSIYVLLASFIPVSIVGLRKDSVFLRKFSAHYKLIICADLIVFSLPFLLLFILKSCYLYIPILLSVILMVAYRPVVFSTPSAKGLKLKLISSINFEWRAGVRQHRILLLLLYILSLVLLPFPIVSLAGVWFLHFVFISFYQYNEPASFIAVYGRSGKEILFSKIRKALTLQAIFQFPVIILYAIFQEGTLLIPFVVFSPASDEHGICNHCQICFLSS
ncbi:MAG: hypothetical protein IPP46_08505 [Bacteroidetes bacterium]|nr:hypothetical protein [Bacteroidota bacterium]